MNPYSATREQMTNNLLQHQIPPNASQEWTEQVEKSQNLLKKLAFHDAMKPNLQQTYMTPANSKNNVYFMWDFVGRTLGILFQIPADLENLNTDQEEGFPDAIGRSVMAADLILDSKPGTLDMMMEMTYPDQRGRHPVFGEPILEAARALKSKVW